MGRKRKKNFDCFSGVFCVVFSDVFCLLFFISRKRLSVRFLFVFLEMLLEFGWDRFIFSILKIVVI